MCNKSAVSFVYNLETMLTNTKYNFLVQQYRNGVYTYSFYMLKNRMDADDVTQEVLIRIWKNMNKFKLLSAKSWIMKTTHNLCLDFLRRRKKELEKNPYSTEDILEYTTDKQSEDPVMLTENKINDTKVKEAIKKLPEKIRSVFVLYEIDGMKYKEISKVLDLPINSVKVYILRARKKLQNELQLLR